MEDGKGYWKINITDYGRKTADMVVAAGAVFLL